MFTFHSILVRLLSCKEFLNQKTQLFFGQVVNANLVNQCILVFLVGDDKFALFAIYIAEQMVVSFVSSFYAYAFKERVINAERYVLYAALIISNRPNDF